VRHLRCPVCHDGFVMAAGSLRCDHGHHFDVARQGYVNLLTARAPAGADTPEMVAARAELLAEGHFDYLTEALLDTATQVGPGPDPGQGLVVDVGAGTGHYLAAVLTGLPDHHGLALDVSKAAARRAAQAHPRAGAAVCDVWRGLPVADACADLVLDVFAPRNAAEFRRVLRPDGALLVVTPSPDHLGELVTTLGLIGVDPDKDRRLDATFGQLFRLERETPYEHALSLRPDAAARFVAMGPSSWHTDQTELATKVANLPQPITTTSAVTVRVYRPLS